MWTGKKKKKKKKKGGRGEERRGGEGKERREAGLVNLIAMIFFLKHEKLEDISCVQYVNVS